MPKKKNTPNGFQIFARQWKQDEERKGRNFPNGVNDVKADPLCYEAWNKLTIQDKDYYKNEAKNVRIQPKIDKKTSTGESLHDITEAQNKAQLFISSMAFYLDTLIEKAMKQNVLDTYKFHTLHINYFYTREEESELKYYPAEIGIVEFSIKNGVIKEYHKILNSKVVTGYFYAAKKHSMDTHQIPIDAGPGTDQIGEDLNEEICKEIYEFLKPKGSINGKLPPLYTYNLPEYTNPAQQFIESLSNMCDKFASVKVYSFDELFVRLCNAKGNPDSDIFDIFRASFELKKDPYDHMKRIQCYYHKKLPAAGKFCSLSMAHRWVFVLLKNLNNNYKLPEEVGFGNKYKFTVGFNNPTPYNSTKPKDVSVNSPMIKHRSERTYEDEQNRRKESTPLSIVLHGDVVAVPTEILTRAEKKPAARAANVRNAATVATVATAPLTKPQCEKQSDSVVLNENNFPTIGRGAKLRSRTRQDNSSSISYASRLK